MRTFLELRADIAHRLGNIDLSTTANADLLTSIKLALNNIQEECNKVRDLRKFLLKKGRILVVAEYTTGTMAVTNGSKTITIATGVFTSDFKDRVFVCDDDIDVEYRIASITDANNAKLDVAYSDTTNTAATFKILKDRYYLGRDVMGVWNMVDRTNEDIIVLENKTTLSDPDIFDTDTDSEPSDGAIILSSDAFYNTGTVAVTNAANTIVITTGDFIEAMDGMAVRIDGDSVDYTFTYVDADNGTLDRVYEGTTNATATFKIAPPGQLMVELYEKPTEQIIVDFDYLYRLPRLVNDNDISIITTLSDNVLWRGAIWAMKDNEDIDANDINNAYQYYQLEKDKMMNAVGELSSEVSTIPYKDL